MIRNRWVRGIRLGAFALVFVGCGGEGDAPPDGVVDGGTFAGRDAAAADAGRYEADGGMLGTDGGAATDGGPDEDSGAAETDAGRALVDAGCGPAAPFELVPTAAAMDLEAAVIAFDMACRSGHSWCNSAFEGAWEVPVCSSPPATLARVVETVLVRTGDRAGFVDGDVLSAADFDRPFFFSPTYSPTGPDLRAAAEDFVGADPEAWYYLSEVPCHNCTEFEGLLIVWSPSTGHVAAIRGTYGYDS